MSGLRGPLYATNGQAGGWRNAQGDPASEMGDMYYVSLNNQAGVGLNNFNSLKNGIYWTSAEYGPSTSELAWTFNMTNGLQSISWKGNEFYTWVVRDGDILAAAPVPIPAAFWLFGSSLLIFWKSRRRQ